MIVETTQIDSDLLSQIKPGYDINNIVERFRWLAENVNGTWYICKQDNLIIGWCVAVWSGKKTHPEYPDMQDLFIRPEHRNKRYGTQLISEIEKIVKARGYDSLGLAVNPDTNQDARRLYERLGYQHDGKEQYLDGIYGGFEDWVIDLEKKLA